MTQKQAILKILKDGHSLTALLAIKELGCMRLASRVAELRKEGHNIQGEIVTYKGKSFKRYFMKGKK